MFLIVSRKCQFSSQLYLSTDLFVRFMLIDFLFRFLINFVCFLLNFCFPQTTWCRRRSVTRILETISTPPLSSSSSRNKHRPQTPLPAPKPATVPQKSINTYRTYLSICFIVAYLQAFCKLVFCLQLFEKFVQTLFCRFRDNRIVYLFNSTINNNYNLLFIICIQQNAIN